MGPKRTPEGTPPGTARTANTVGGDVSGTAVQAERVEGGAGNTTTTNTTNVTHTTVVEQERGLPTALQGLPPLVGEFVGRDEQLRGLLDLVDPTTTGTGGGGAVVVSAVAGMGGVGKTALALRAAHAAWERGWFSAYLFVDLHGYTPGTDPLTGAGALDALLRQTGADLEDIPVQADQRAAFYRSALVDLSQDDARRRPVLVIADNAHHTDQVQHLFPGTGRHRLLVTSREALPLGGGGSLSLDTLTPEAAVKVLTGHLPPTDPRRQDDEGLEALAGRCGYLPLALTIAAALLARKTRLAPARLAVRLGELSKFTDGRHDLAAVFEASLTHRSAEERRVFALLGSNPGADISTVAAAAMVGLQVEDAEEVLEELAAAHLITTPAEGRWAMHDLVAAHARTLTPPATCAPRHGGGPEGTAPPADARERALERVLAFYTQTAAAADDHLRALPGDTPPEVFSSREQALAWLDTEIGNLLACVSTAHHTVMHLPFILATYLDLRRRFDDDIDAHTLARDLYHQTGDTHREAVAWNNLGKALRQVRRFDDAINAHTRAHDLHQQAGNAHGEAVAWSNLGLALAEVGRSDEAINAHTRAREAFHQAGDTHREAGAWGNLGTALQEVGRMEEAIDALTRARDLSRQVGDARGEAMAWNNLGLALREVGRVEEALEAFARDLAYCRQVGDGHGEAQTLHNVGVTLAGLGRVGEAVQALARAVELFEAAGDDHRAARAREALDQLRQDPGGEQES
ncbi:tetratricopeptide repeat protein [Nocardiopsis flavescens]|nr:tetratricopeptide repeat protein [Nocardiopsis flavescens]